MNEATKAYKRNVLVMSAIVVAVAMDVEAKFSQVEFFNLAPTQNTIVWGLKLLIVYNGAAFLAGGISDYQVWREALLNGKDRRGWIWLLLFPMFLAPNLKNTMPIAYPKGTFKGFIAEVFSSIFCPHGILAKRQGNFGFLFTNANFVGIFGCNYVSVIRRRWLGFWVKDMLLPVILATLAIYELYKTIN